MLWTPAMRWAWLASSLPVVEASRRVRSRRGQLRRGQPLRSRTCRCPRLEAVSVPSPGRRRLRVAELSHRSTRRPVWPLTQGLTAPLDAARLVLKPFGYVISFTPMVVPIGPGCAAVPGATPPPGTHSHRSAGDKEVVKDERYQRCQS